MLCAGEAFSDGKGGCSGNGRKIRWLDRWHVGKVCSMKDNCIENRSIVTSMFDHSG